MYKFRRPTGCSRAGLKEPGWLERAAPGWKELGRVLNALVRVGLHFKRFAWFAVRAVRRIKQIARFVVRGSRGWLSNKTIGAVGAVRRSHKCFD